MPYKNPEDRKRYQSEYHAFNKLRTSRRVAKHRRMLKADVTILGPNTCIEERVCNNPVTNPVTNPKDILSVLRDNIKTIENGGKIAVQVPVEVVKEVEDVLVEAFHG